MLRPSALTLASATRLSQHSDQAEPRPQFFGGVHQG
jgi:hypothetical protein